MVSHSMNSQAQIFDHFCLIFVWLRAVSMHLYLWRTTRVSTHLLTSFPNTFVLQEILSPVFYHETQVLISIASANKDFMQFFSRENCEVGKSKTMRVWLGKTVERIQRKQTPWCNVEAYDLPNGPLFLEI